MDFEIDEEVEDFIEAVYKRWRATMEILQEREQYWKDHCATIHAKNLKLRRELFEWKKRWRHGRHKG